MNTRHFSIHITEEHLVRAQAGEEQYCASILDESVNCEIFIDRFTARVEDIQKQFGKLTWYILPSYPIEDSEDKEFPDSAYSILGVSEQATVLLDVQPGYERQIWRTTESAGVLVEEFEGGPCITIRVHIDVVNTLILHRYYESHVEGTLFAQRCVAIHGLITCANNYSTMHKLECPAEILAGVEENYKMRRQQCKALFHGMAPPSLREKDWAKKLNQYLIGFGMEEKTGTALLRGEHVAPVNTYEAETRAVVSKERGLHMFSNVISRNEILPTGTESVITAENMNEYIVPFTQIVTASKKTVADLTRLEKIARDYNRPITFI